MFESEPEWLDIERANIEEWRGRLAVIHDVLCEAGLVPAAKPVEDPNLCKRFMSNYAQGSPNRKGPHDRCRTCGKDARAHEGVRKAEHNDFKLPDADSKRKSIDFLARTGRGNKRPANYTPAGGGLVSINLEAFYRYILPLISQSLDKKRSK